MTENVIASQPRSGVTVLTLNRPERLNAMTAELVQDLHNALDAVDADPNCRVVILTGAGRGFCAGLALRGYGRPPTAQAGEMGKVQLGMETQQHIASLIPHMRGVRQPIIAAVNGPATGGGLALVLGSDIRIAGSGARFGAAFIKIGLSACDIGTSWLLPRIVGVGRAHELMLTGRVFDADEAGRIGLVIEVVPDDQLMARCIDEAVLIMQNSPYGVWMTKETMWASVETPGMAAAIDLENRTQIMCTATGDSVEAIDAFLSKRPPSWAPVD